jgi:hypothetical protein
MLHTLEVTLLWVWDQTLRLETSGDKLGNLMYLMPSCRCLIIVFGISDVETSGSAMS